MYNKACLESLRNNKEKAIENLKKAIELEPESKSYAKEEHDFDNARDSKEFQELIED